jgi:RNA polymerase sigma-70 factor (ECF subfamily)
MVADNDVAKDVVQEVFIKYFENRERLDGDTRIKVWLFKSARNRCLNYIRDRGKISNIGDGGYELPSPAITESERIDSSDIIVKLFDDLPIDYREILVMREWSELSYGEIAETLDTTVSAVKSKLFKARKKASEIYKKFYGDE